MKYIDCDVEMPPANIFIMGLLRGNKNEKCICKWHPGADTWGSHISVKEWRHLTDKEWIQLDRGEIKSYSKMRG